MKIDKRFVGKHSKGCLAGEQGWNTVWSSCPESRFLDKNGGHRSRNEVWLEFPCNDPECKAKLLLRADDVLLLAGECTKETPDE